MSRASPSLKQKLPLVHLSSDPLAGRSTNLPNMDPIIDTSIISHNTATHASNHLHRTTHHVEVQSNDGTKYVPIKQPNIPTQTQAQVSDSIQNLGDAISEFGNQLPSSSSRLTLMPTNTSLGDSEEDDREPVIIPSISTREETLIMKQYPPWLEKDRTKLQKCFRIRDDKKNRRYYAVRPIRSSHNESEYVVLDVIGQIKWNVNPGSSRSQKILRKPDRDYYILLVRTNWISLQKKLVEGYAIRDGTAKLVFSVKGDELDRKFTVIADGKIICTAQRDSERLDFDKNIPLNPTILAGAATDYNIARWTISVGPEVDTALMTAIFTCVWKWVQHPRSERRKLSSDSAGSGLTSKHHHRNSHRRRNSEDSDKSIGSSSSRKQR